MKSALNWLRRHRVAVLKGGWSRERPISLKTGLAVEQAFTRLRVRVQSIDVGRNITNQLRKQRVQFAFIALHGAFGEDGGIQTLLESLKIPYTGSGPLASSIAMDKILSKKIFVESGVPTAPWKTLSNRESVADVRKWLRKGSVFVKPFDQGSAIGASRVNQTSELPRALRECFRVSKIALVEKFVAGRELTVGILGRTALPVVEILPKHAFYDFHSKYARGGSQHLVPAPLTRLQTKTAQSLALRAFEALGCTVYGRVDLLMSKTGQMFVLEVNTIPGMTATSLLPDAARAAGTSFDQLVLKICDLSLEPRKMHR